MYSCVDKFPRYRINFKHFALASSLGKGLLEVPGVIPTYVEPK